ncbi:MAG: glycosyltransferase [Candidatus Kapaibacteriales bacterium]
MKKRILMVMPRAPYPPIGGDNVKNYQLLQILSKHYNIDLVIIHYEDYQNVFEEKLKAFVDTLKIFKFPKLQFQIRMFKYFLNKYPAQINFYYFKKVQDYINKKSQSADLIMSFMIRTARYVQQIPKPKILDMPDSLGLNYRNSFRQTSSLFWKSIYLFEYPKLIHYEKQVIKLFDRVFFFNKEEEEFFHSSNTCWIPHGVNSNLMEYNKYDPQYSNYISFLGKMNYQPNIDAVTWFSKNVLPHLPSDIKFQIIGAYPKPQVFRLARENPRVVIRGYLEDPYLLLKSSLCVVAPMQTGGGIQNKILESLALGTVVITTPKPSVPISLGKKDVVLVANTAEEWIKLINDIYQNPMKYEHLKINARRHIKENFTWDIYGEKVLQIIEELFSQKI